MCTRVRYKRNVVLIIGQQKFHGKKMSCFLISYKYGLYEIFFTPKFSRSTVIRKCKANINTDSNIKHLWKILVNDRYTLIEHSSYDNGY